MKYFLHDSNAFNDEKITQLYLEFGYEGLGLFYTLLEKLAMQEKPVNTLVLKSQLNVGKKLNRCWNFMESIGLIHSNNGETFNKQLLNFSEKYTIKKEKNAERIRQWRENQDVTKNVTDYESVRNAPKDKISKVKEKSLSERELLRLEIIRNLSGNGRTQEEIETLATQTVEEDWRQFGRLTEWIAEHTPNVADMKEPITLRQFVKLREEIKDKAKITELLKNMQNWKPLLQKNVSAYQTLLNWAKRENK